MLFGIFGHNEPRWVNLVFIPKKICIISFSEKTRRLSIYSIISGFILCMSYGYALALGEIYRPEQIGVFKYSLEKPKFGNFIIKLIETLKMQVFF